jgi:hypothetical protein
MSVALENFSEAARYSEEEHIFYTAIFKKYCKQEMSTMDPKVDII